MNHHYLTFRALAAEWNSRLSGAEVSEILTQAKNELLLTFRLAGGDGNATLHCSVDPQMTYAVVRPMAQRARRNSVDLFDQLRGEILLSCSLHPSDRTLDFAFGGGSHLFFRLYGTAENNILLADSRGIILNAFKNGRDLRGTTFEPSPNRSDVITDPVLFRAALMKSASKPLGQALRHAVPVLGPVYIAEILPASGCNSAAAAEELDDAAISRIRVAVVELFLKALHPEASICRMGDGSYFTSVMPLKQQGVEGIQSFGGMNEAVAASLAAGFRRAAGERSDPVLERISESRAAIAKSLGRTSDRHAPDPSDVEQLGRLLLMNIGEVRKGMTSIEVANELHGGTVRITLDPALPPAANAEKYFEKAKNIKRDREESEKRAREFREKDAVLALLESSRAACETDEARKEWMQAHEDELEELGLGGGEDEKEKPPFRLFVVAGGYEVWVGKNSANNDLLTFRYAKPNDIWMHARGSSGSHTVVKVREKGKVVPKEALQQAAGIAAYYSKMRNAKHVPVAYCERKYVRKPRGAQAGTVTLEREEILFVNPRLP
jgi:predicted ribosome quality control (RQC) complex YloA/Tae2 family protein